MAVICFWFVLRSANIAQGGFCYKLLFVDKFGRKITIVVRRLFFVCSGRFLRESVKDYVGRRYRSSVGEGGGLF